MDGGAAMKVPDGLGSSLRQIAYLSLAIGGLLSTQSANVSFVQASGGVFDVADFIRQAGVNDAARSLSFDLLFGATAVVVWMETERRRLQLRHGLWPILLSMGVAFAFGVPLFLLLRERHLRALELARIDADPGASA
jgi:Terpene cyclase DEP1